MILLGRTRFCLEELDSAWKNVILLGRMRKGAGRTSFCLEEREKGLEERLFAWKNEKRGWKNVILLGRMRKEAGRTTKSS